MGRAVRLLFRQLFDTRSYTYTYILGCTFTRKAVIIDPVLEKVDRDTKLIEQLGFTLSYGLNTHVHADHVTGTGELKKRFPNMLSVLSKTSGGLADVLVETHDIIQFGHGILEVRQTPGHTPGCVTFVNHQDKRAFTGDALLIRGCGRTDFPGGDPATLYHSIHDQIFSLRPDFKLYPGHDYDGFTVTTVAEEKHYNPRLTKGEKRFVRIMDDLHLNPPQKIEMSVPANRVCGVFEEMDEETRNKILQSHE